MTLYEGETGKSYRIHSIVTKEELAARLRALGIREHATTVILSRRKKGAMIISIKGTRMALGRKIAEGIRIREEESDDHGIPAKETGRQKRRNGI